MDTVNALALLTFAVSFGIVLGWLCFQPIARFIRRREERIDEEDMLRQFGGYGRTGSPQRVSNARAHARRSVSRTTKPPSDLPGVPNGTRCGDPGRCRALHRPPSRGRRGLSVKTWSREKVERESRKIRRGLLTGVPRGPSAARPEETETKPNVATP